MKGRQREISDEQIRMMVKLRSEGDSLQKIADIFGIGKTTVYSYTTKKKAVLKKQMSTQTPRRKTRHIPTSEIETIFMLKDKGVYQKDIAKKLCVSGGAISRVLNNPKYIKKYRYNVTKEKTTNNQPELNKEYGVFLLGFRLPFLKIKKVQ